jgi:(E)-4-hydroxy-3-methylbut-2-enyl-diphosphate synthase
MVESAWKSSNRRAADLAAHRLKDENVVEHLLKLVEANAAQIEAAKAAAEQAEAAE